MSKHSETLIESTPFMAGMTALGGFCNAYTGMTRGGVFANAHTANMAKLGLSLATLNWSSALNALAAILSCVGGALLCEFVKEDRRGGALARKGDWPRRALVMELVALLIVGFIPATVPHAPVNAFLSFVTGFQLNLFRQWVGGGHSTTICTGNLRSLAQYIHGIIRRETPDAGRKTAVYALLVFSFCLGAFLSALLCLWVGVKASWAGCLFLAIWLVWMHLDRKRTGASA